MNENILRIRRILSMIRMYLEIKDLVMDEYSHPKHQKINIDDLRLTKYDIDKILTCDDEYIISKDEADCLIELFATETNISENLSLFEIQVVSKIVEGSVRDYDNTYFKWRTAVSGFVGSCLTATRFF